MSETAPLSIIFAGTPDFAAIHLQGLLEEGAHKVVAVYTQPDRPAGRGKQLTISPVKALAKEYDIPVYQPENFKAVTSVQQLQALQADVMVVVAYGLLLPKAVLETPRFGCINVHASLLPRWRGAAPIQRAVEAGDAESGVTIMQMDEGLDTGAMLLTASCPIDANETGGSLHDKLATVGVPALRTVLTQIASHTICPEAQNDKLSNYAKKIDKSELIINWQLSATEIERKIRAFNPFPICYSSLNQQRIKIWQAVIGPAHTAEPGTIIQADKNGIVVACGEGSLSLQQLQLPGKKALPVSDIINGHGELFKPGAVLAQP